MTRTMSATSMGRLPSGMATARTTSSTCKG